MPRVTIRSASQGGTRPPCSGRSATPDRFTAPLCHRGYVQEIIQAGKRGAGLTRQLLAFSRRQVLEPTVVDSS